MKKNNVKTFPAVDTERWQEVIPQFGGGKLAYYRRMRHEFLLWQANLNCFHREDGTAYWTYYPFTQNEWENSFGCWLDANAVEGNFTREDVYPEPDRADVYIHWLEFLSEEAERAAHWLRCKVAYEEMLYDLD